MVLFKPLASIETHLAGQLKEAGNDLFNLPSSIYDLLTLLDKFENLFASMEQAPSKSIQDALLPSMLQPYLQEAVCSMGVASDTFCPIKVGQGVDATFKLVEVLVLLPALRKKDSIVLDDEKVVSFPTPIPHIESDFHWVLNSTLRQFGTRWKEDLPGGNACTYLREAKVCEPIQNGGLGVKTFRIFNKSLLGKWLWRYGIDREAFWWQVVEVKYMSLWGGLCTKEIRGAYGGAFLDLFSIVGDKEAAVADFVSVRNGKLHWEWGRPIVLATE
uniref:Reverse transcriptase zinc-binding domain-containing protein n=1 Tax=Fagus sylvatica TaxID=28930 RepID=A0A2N9IHD4_FAGSY